MALIDDLVDAHTKCNVALANWVGPPNADGWQLEIQSLNAAITGLSQHEAGNGAVTVLRQLLESSRNRLQTNPPPQHGSPSANEANTFCVHARNTARAYRRVIDLGL